MLPRSRRVLLIDHDMLCEFIKDGLAADGHRAEIAHTASAALAKFMPHKYDVVFTGSQLPDMNGEELARAIKQLDHSQSIIMLAALPPSPVPAELLRVIPKPFVFQDITDALAELPH